MVEIKTAKQIDPKIYAYTTPMVIDNDGWIKIGYTERDVETRVKEQTHTANIRADIRWCRNAEFVEGINKGELFKDHDFHQFLRFHDIKRRPKTEWFFFNGTPEKSEELFDKFVHNDLSGYQSGKNQEYKLRGEQEKAVHLTKKYYETYPNGEFLWNAKPRFGKTLATYDLIKTMNFRNALIVTNRPAVANSWFDDFDKFIASSTKYKFVSESDSLKGRPTLSRQEFIEIVSSDDKIRQIAFLSLQDLKGSKYFGGIFDKLRWVSELDWDILVIDEAHEGVDTFKTDVAFNKINRRFTLHLSGTPFRAIANDKFNKNQIYNWSYADEQACKENWDNETDGENPYDELPQLNMFTYQMSNMIKERLGEGVQVGDYNVDYAFDLNEFFSTNESGDFIYKDSVLDWIDTLTQNEKYPFSTKELRNELKHTFWLLDRVASARALKKVLEENPIFENYKIVLAAGDGNLYDNDESIQKSFDAVRKAIEENDKTITLSVGQLTTGVTIPEWTGVLMLSNIKSPSLYMQAAFRVQNPYKWIDRKGKCYKKDKAYVFDFAPERTLIIFDQFANNLSLDTVDGKGTVEKQKENIRELLNFFPVVAEDQLGKMTEIDATDVMTIPKKIRAKEVVKRGFMSNLLFDNITGIFQCPEKVMDILNNMPVEGQGKTQNHNKSNVGSYEFSDDGDVIIPNEIIINKKEELFGDKIFSLKTEVSKNFEHGSDELDKTILDTKKIISETFVKDLASEYEINKKEQKNISIGIENKFDDLVKRHKIELNIETAKIESDYSNKLAEAKTNKEKDIIKRQLEKDIDNVATKLQDNLTDKINKFIGGLPTELVESQELKRIEKEKSKDEEIIRGRLRGFARTIPSFLMAYGDDKLRLSNFDIYLPDDVFKEVTGITLDEFRFLRDGGDGFKGHLFDESTFDESIQEFLRKKYDLASYFNDEKEDIFDYIPPQKTNQIFTPKRVVRKMVDDLESENPGIFDDSNKTFIDLYMKSGLYIAEIVKRLYNSEEIKRKFPNMNDRIKHILENQVYGFAPTEIIYKIATNYIFGTLDKDISRKNFVKEDTIPYAKKGTVSELVDKYFGH